jgi:uncharacterized membrane protein
MTTSDVATTDQAGAAAAGASRTPDKRGRRVERIVGVTDELILQFSRPASQITGRLISLFGLALIVTVLVLATMHLLGSEDFVAATIAGALLAIAGIFTLLTDYVSAQNAAIIEAARIGAEELKRTNGSVLEQFRAFSD